MGQGRTRLAGEPTRIRVAGELSPIVDEFRRVLTESGFTRHTVTTHTHLIADLSDWLTRRGLTAEQFTVDELPVFLADRRAAGRTALVSTRGAAPMMAFLRERGLIPAASLPVPSGPTGHLVADYCRYLESERGLAPLSILRYLTTARLFLTSLPEPLMATLQELSADLVIAFVLEEASRRRVWSAKSLVTALRSLLRFLHVAGYAPVGLATAVPAVAGWGLQSLPRGIDANLLTAMLWGCDRHTPLGRRDYAILLTLGTVVNVVATAARRAGAAGPVSPHRLRHTVASDLLARGAPLIEIGQLLRHEVESTTAIYAKLDYHALRELVRPWPGA